MKLKKTFDILDMLTYLLHYIVFETIYTLIIWSTF